MPEPILKSKPLKMLMSANTVSVSSGLTGLAGFSGSMVRAREMFNYFTGKNYQISIVTNQAGKKYFRANGIKTEFLLTSGRMTKHHSLIAFCINFAGSIKYLRHNLHTDIIYSTSDLFPDVFFSIFYRLLIRKAPIICGCHLLVPLPSDKKTLARSLFHSAYSYYSQKIILILLKHLADIVLVSNHIDRNILINRGFSKKQVLVAYGAPDSSSLPRDPLPMDDRKYDIVFLASEHPRKGIKFIRDIFQEHQTSGSELKIVSAGYQPSLSKEFGNCRNIKFTGGISGKEKYDLLENSRVMLLPSSHESFSLVTCEAMNCGTPVIAFSSPILRMIYREGMRFVEFGDVKRMWKEAESLLHNPKELALLGSEAFSYGKRFRWEKTGDAIFKAIGKIRSFPN